VCRPGNPNFISANNPASKIIFRHPLNLFMIAMWRSSDVSKPNVKISTEGHIFQ
jgi:hypothetical protein